MYCVNDFYVFVNILAFLFQVYAKYEQFDLTDRKDFIKSTVKEVSQCVHIQAMFHL